MIHPPPEAFVRATELERTHLESRESSPALRILAWAAAGLLTLGVHVGLYLALTRHSATPPALLEMPAAVMIDMSPEPTVAKSATDNASNAPEAANTEQAEPEPEEEAPPAPEPEPVVEAPPPPPTVKPQAVLPLAPPKEQGKPRTKPPERKPIKPVLKMDKPSAASRAGGGPRSDQANADRTAAAAAGAAVSQASRASWQNEMRSRIVRAKRFPPGATGATGITVVKVTFSGSGSVSGVHLIRSSGNAALDAEAVAVMYRAAPFPPPPGGQAITQVIPLNFSRR